MKGNSRLVHAGKQTVQKEENRSMTIFIFGDAEYFYMVLFRSSCQAESFNTEDVYLSNFRNVTHEQFQKANY